MNKKNKFKITMTYLFMLLILFNGIFAVGGVISQEDLSKNKDGVALYGASNIGNTAKNIWSTVAVIVQIVAVAAVVFAGLRYMFAAADTKADIKKQTLILVVGAVFVFCAISILGLINGAAGTILTLTP